MAGPQAEPIDAVRALADRRFDEAPDDLAITEPTAPERAPAVEGAIVGIPASPGIAVGPVRHLHVPELPVQDGARGTPEEERSRLEAAIAAVRADITHQREAAIVRVGAGEAAIFDAHLLFLQDEALLGPARDGIPDRGAAAAGGCRHGRRPSGTNWTIPTCGSEPAISGVGRQVLARLLGVEAPHGRLSAPGLLVVSDLEPADTIALDPASCHGIAVSHGGPTSHAAVLARALGIPAVVGLGDRITEIAEGVTIGLDGRTGVVQLSPSSSAIALLEAERAEQLDRERSARARASESAVTKDGRHVSIMACQWLLRRAAASPRGATAWACSGAVPVPRARPMRRKPNGRRRIGGRGRARRSSRCGRSTPAPTSRSVPRARSRGTFLGVQGFRLTSARPEILHTQLRALVRVCADHPVRIMFPIVATLEELRTGLTEVGTVAATVGTAPPEVGVMI